MDSKELSKKIKAITDKYNLTELRKELYMVKDGVRTVSKKREEEIYGIISKYEDETNQITLDFIKENSKSLFIP